jgi:hypothetical protein
VADCDHFDAIAGWGEGNLPFLRRYLPYEHGVPGGRWLTLLMNRVDPALFSTAFTAWVRETWPERPELIAIDGKTSRRSHDRAEEKAPLHLVSAFATTSRLVLGQEAVEGKSNELSAIPVLLDRLSEGGSLKGALVSIAAIAATARIAQAIVDKGADYRKPPVRCAGQSGRGFLAAVFRDQRFARAATSALSDSGSKAFRSKSSPSHSRISSWRSCVLSPIASSISA